MSALWLYLSGKTKWSFSENFHAVNYSDIFTVDDTATIILSAFAAVRSADLCPHDVEDDLDLHRVFESQFNYSM